MSKTGIKNLLNLKAYTPFDPDKIFKYENEINYYPNETVSMPNFDAILFRSRKVLQNYVKY